MNRSALLALTILLGCSGSSDPSKGPPHLGVYHYSADRFLTNGNTEHFTGTLTLTYASKDSIAGFWKVQGSISFFYDSLPELGFFNVDAYVLYATMRFKFDSSAVGLLASNRFEPRGDGGLKCQEVRFIDSGGSIPGPCSISFTGP